MARYACRLTATDEKQAVNHTTCCGLMPLIPFRASPPGRENTEPETRPANDIDASTRRAIWAQLAGISYRVDLAIGASGPMVGVSDGDASTEESDSE